MWVPHSVWQVNVDCRVNTRMGLRNPNRWSSVQLDNELDIIVLIFSNTIFSKKIYVLNVVTHILSGGGLLTSHYASHRPSQFVVDFLLSNGPNSSLLNMLPLLIYICGCVCFTNIFRFLEYFWPLEAHLVWMGFNSLYALGFSSKNVAQKDVICFNFCLIKI